MRRKKCFLALLLTASMVITSLSGCGKQKEADTPTDAENGTSEKAAGGEDGDLYTIDILTDVAQVDSSLDTVVGQWIADEFGIAFNYVTYAGDVQEKQALMLAGGDYNEIQYMQYQTMVQQYIDAGALLNLDDYKELLPDFYERFEEQIPYWRITAKDGGLYKWESHTPQSLTALLPHFDVMVRSDVLEYYGYPNLVTASDWKEFLGQAVKDFPASYDGQATVGLTVPLAESWGMQGVVPVGYEKGDTYVAAGNDYFTWNVKTEQFEDYLLNPYVKESFQFFNELYKEGILDEECFTDSLDVTTQKMSDGRAIAVWYMSWMNDTANDTLTKAGHPEMSYIEMPFQLDSQAGQKRNSPAIISYPYVSFGVTKNCKDPERVLKFINWCCTEEGQLMLQCGIEGVHYTVEDGVRVPTELRYECSNDLEVAKREGVLDRECVFRGLPYCICLAEDGAPYGFGGDQEYTDENTLSEREREVYEGLGWESSNQWWEDNIQAIDPGFSQSCALDTTSDLGKVGAKMTELRVKYSANLLMTDDFDAVWQELMTEYDKLDHEAVIDAMNEILEEYKATLNK